MIVFDKRQHVPKFKQWEQERRDESRSSAETASLPLLLTKNTRIKYSEVLENRTMQTSFINLFVDYLQNKVGGDTLVVIDWYDGVLYKGNSPLPRPSGNTFGEGDLAIFRSVLDVSNQCKIENWMIAASDTDLVAIGLPIFVQNNIGRRQAAEWYLFYSKKAYSFEVNLHQKILVVRELKVK